MRTNHKHAKKKYNFTTLFLGTKKQPENLISGYFFKVLAVF